MRITSRGRYALRAVIYLINHASEKPVSIRQMSDVACLSQGILEQIFFRLRKAGIVNSTRGPFGGFYINRNPREITVDDVFMAMEEGYHIAPCSTDDPDVLCERSDECITCGFWTHTYEALRTYFSTVSIQDIIDGNYSHLKITNHPKQKESIVL